MIKSIFVVAFWVAAAWAQSDPAREVLALERQAMDGWQKGDPDPALAISDPDITYFHAVTDQRVEGLAALKTLYEPYRGRPLFDSYEIANPKVQPVGDVAILTYQLVRHNGSITGRWNATQVYQKKKDGWKVIHSHFSAAKQV